MITESIEFHVVVKRGMVQINCWFIKSCGDPLLDVICLPGCASQALA